MAASTPHSRRLRGRGALGLVALFITVGCASVEPGRPGQLQGSAGPVTWEVSDIGRVVSADNQRIRWSYLITLRNTSDRAIQLEHITRALTSDYADATGGAPVSQPFRRTLGARSELRVPASENWGWRSTTSTPQFGGSANLRGITVFRSFSGTDDGGAPVQIQVRLPLDRSTGRLAQPATMPKSLPAPKRLESDRDLRILTGVWRGSYRMDGTLLDVPFELTILTDLTCQVAENDPVTNRYRRAVRVKDGGLEYSGDRERGTLMLHEADGRRMLAGRISQVDGPPYAIYLEAQRTTSAALPGAP
ncbi:MAG TPA: hypothetical protein VHO73_11090 [Methylomirabilota bacterium]|jgi:hypothetical protein|nr:hypothetical protein [Methylomirabilota bacterium]